MKNINIISGIRHDLKMYLAEVISEGDCYWTTELDSAKKFNSMQDAIKYNNINFIAIVNMVDVGTIKIQAINFNDIGTYEDMDIYKNNNHPNQVLYEENEYSFRNDLINFITKG